MHNDNIALILRVEPAKHRTLPRRVSRNPTRSHIGWIRSWQGSLESRGAISHIKMGDSIASCNITLTMRKYCFPSSWDVACWFVVSSWSLMRGETWGFIWDTVLWKTCNEACLWHVWHSTTPRHFAATPILKFDLFLSFVISKAVSNLETGRLWAAIVFFFFEATSRDNVRCRQWWLVLVS